jgi:hypothetical protein
MNHNPIATGARACVPAQGSALWRQDPDREALPLTSRPSSPPMPDARLRPRRRRPPR